MTSKLQATRARVEAQKFRGNMGNKFAGKPKAEAGAGVGSGMVSVDGQYYASDVSGAGAVTVVNTGRPAAAQYTANTGGGTVVLTTGGSSTGGGGVTDHGDLTGLYPDDDHPQYLTPARGNLLYPTLTLWTAHLANVNAHHNKQHNIIDAAHHTATGSQWQVVGLTALNTPGLLTPLADASGAQTGLLRSNAGNVKLDSVTAAQINTAAGNLTLAPASGFVTLPAAGTINTASGDLNMAPAGALTLGAGSQEIVVSPSALLKSLSYSSQTAGWGISYAGGGDFRYLYADEMHVKSFVADLEQALAGGQIISKSVAVLDQVFTAPAAGGSTTLTVRDLPSATGMRVFENADFVRVRTFSRAGGSLTVGDCWGTVTLDLTYGTSGFDASTKTQRYTFTRSSGTIGGGNPPGGMALGTQVQPDAIILDYGKSGNGISETTTVDGVYGENSPYWQVAVWTTHPATGLATRVRGGNLKGITGVTEFGLFAGSTTAGNLLAVGDRVALRQGTNEVIRLNSDGNSYFAGIMTIGAGGELRQGTVTSGNVWDSLTGFTGLRLWRDTNVGRIGGYNLGTLQWHADTDGKLYAGAGDVEIGANGIRITEADSAYLGTSAISFIQRAGSAVVGSVAVQSQPAGRYMQVGLETSSRIEFSADAAGQWIDNIATGGVKARRLRARDANGLGLVDGSGNMGIFIEDGGQVGIGTVTPATGLHVLGQSRFEQESTAAQFVGSTHVYMEFYPGGVAAGRKGYFGYPASASENLTFGNQYSGGKIEFFGADTGASLKSFFSAGWASTTAVEANLGANRNGDTAFDLIGDTTYTDYGLRVLRRSGANAGSEIVNRGTGSLKLVSIDAAAVEIYTNAVSKFKVAQTYTLNNGITGAIAEIPLGLVVISNITTGAVGVFVCSGSAGTIIDVSVGSTFSSTNGTASKTNFYFSGGAYRIQNNTGVPCTYYLTIIGSS